MKGGNEMLGGLYIIMMWSGFIMMDILIIKYSIENVDWDLTLIHL